MRGTVVQKRTSQFESSESLNVSEQATKYTHWNNYHETVERTCPQNILYTEIDSYKCATEGGNASTGM